MEYLIFGATCFLAILCAWSVVLLGTMVKIMHIVKCKMHKMCRVEDLIQLGTIVGFGLFSATMLLGFPHLVPKYISVFLIIELCTLFTFFHLSERCFFNLKAIKKALL